MKKLIFAVLFMMYTAVAQAESLETTVTEALDAVAVAYYEAGFVDGMDCLSKIITKQCRLSVVGVDLSVDDMTTKVVVCMNEMKKGYRLGSGEEKRP